MSLSNRQLKLINSLHSKKGRRENLKFLVEGEKGINELLESDWEIDFFVINEKYLKEFSNLSNVYFCEEGEITKLSSLSTNTFGMAVVHERVFDCDFESLKGTFIYLDGIRDPGNLGTIIRICDWYGIEYLFCSPDTTEFYNPKTIVSTMGSFKRVKVVSLAFQNLVEKLPHFKIVGTFLNGTSVYTYKFSENQLIVLGNESNGISEMLEEFIQDKITIPRIGGAESLNVGISTAIILDNFIRAKI